MSWAVVYTYLIWCPACGELEADGDPVRATSSSGAAESWFKGYNGEAQWTDDDKGLLVHVRAPDGSERRWRVTAKLTTIYTSTEVPCAPREEL